ncbi:MAG: hypothetical protein B6A08_16195 [Sorangiineae bacterium NIC37A_2]|nr:MAG: hypothetical protein B6A08_16195 [Sorangiineae bacterium NIC37A_2]
MPASLVRLLSTQMDRDIDSLWTIVAGYVLNAGCEQERAVLRHFGTELAAVKRRIERRPVPPSEEEIEIALTAVLALSRRACSQESQIS